MKKAIAGKWIAVAVFAGLFVVGMLLPVAPMAQACWRDCVYIQCSDGGSGYKTITDYGNDAFTLTKDPFTCRTSCCTETQAYAYCAEFPCSISALADGAPGKLYVVGSDAADIVELTIAEAKFDAIVDAIEHSRLQRDIAIASAASLFSLPYRHLTVEQFNNRHGGKVQ